MKEGDDFKVSFLLLLSIKRIPVFYTGYPVGFLSYHRERERHEGEDDCEDFFICLIVFGCFDVAKLLL